MDWGDLSFVLALGRAKTMSAAASAMGVNHTTVSRRIKALEKNLGEPLFVGTPDGWEMTPTGEEVFATAERMESEVHDLGRALRGAEQEPSGTLRIASIGSFFIELSRSFAGFAQKYPKIDLELTARNSVVSLTRREADVALRVTNGPPEHLVGRKIGRLEYAVFAHEELCDRFGLARTGFASDDELSRLPWLAWDTSLDARMTEAWLSERDATIVARYDSVEVLAEHLAHGMGAGLVTSLSVRRHPHIRQLTPRIEGFGIDLWLLTHADLRRSASVRALMDHLEADLRELLPSFDVE